MAAVLMCDANKVSVAETSPDTWQVTVNNMPINGYAQKELAVAAAQALVDCDPESKFLDSELLAPSVPDPIQQYLIDCLKAKYAERYHEDIPVEDWDVWQCIEMGLINQEGNPWPRVDQATTEAT